MTLSWSAEVEKPILEAFASYLEILNARVPKLGETLTPYEMFRAGWEAKGFSDAKAEKAALLGIEPTNPT